MYKKERNIALGLIFTILIGVPIFDKAPYHIFVLCMVAINIILVMALNFILGFAGQVFLGTVGFYAIGGYANALLTVNYGLNFWQALVCSVLITSFFSLLLGLPTLKLKGFYLALMSLGFVTITVGILTNWMSFTGGVWGVMGIPRPYIGNAPIRSDLHFYFLAIGIALLLAIFAIMVEDSRFGRAFKAVRDDQLSSEMLGIQSHRVKLLAFLMCGIYSGFAGSLFASLQGFISPEMYTFNLNSTYMCMLVVGGLGSVPGAVLGATLLTIATEMLRFLREKYLTFYALLIIIVLIYQPGGLIVFIRHAIYKYISPLFSRRSLQKE
jgi:branched-chain amino acid transport system permease protein